MDARPPRSRLLDEIGSIDYAFGTSSKPIPAPFENEWEKLKPDWKQIHGTSCAEAIGPRATLGEVDSVFTRARGTPIAVVTADCVPILLARRDGRAVAAVHAGWRGTRRRIARLLFETLGEKPEDWVGVIGPAIGPCCYEVSEELAADFAEFFAEHGKSLAVPRYRILDLSAIGAAELKAMGLRDVEVIRECTRCTVLPDGSPKYRSYRREGGGTRQWSLIRIKP